MGGGQAWKAYKPGGKGSLGLKLNWNEQRGSKEDQKAAMLARLQVKRFGGKEKFGHQL